MSRLSFLAATMVLLLVLAACSSAGEGQEVSVQAAMVGGEAVVTEVEVRPSEISPTQVEVWVSGFFTNTCARISGVSQQRDGNTFLMTIATTRTGTEGCEQEQSAQFVQIIDLDTSELEAGEYTVKVNGFSGRFDLTD